MQKAATIFLSTPMSAFTSESELLSFRESAVDFLLELRSQRFAESVYCALERVRAIEDFDDPLKAAQADLRALAKSDIFVLLYPIRTPTSALIELGYAMALSRPIVIQTPSRALLPFMARQLDQLLPKVEILLADSIDSISIGSLISACRRATDA